MVYRGRVKDGMVLLEGPQTPPEGAAVSVRVLKGPRADRGGALPPTLYERLKDVVGKAKGLPPDASLYVEHYLYGKPKRK